MEEKTRAARQEVTGQAAPRDGPETAQVRARRSGTGKRKTPRERVEQIIEEHAEAAQDAGRTAQAWRDWIQQLEAKTPALYAAVCQLPLSRSSQGEVRVQAIDGIESVLDSVEAGPPEEEQEEREREPKMNLDLAWGQIRERLRELCEETTLGGIEATRWAPVFDDYIKSAFGGLERLSFAELGELLAEELDLPAVLDEDQVRHRFAQYIALWRQAVMEWAGAHRRTLERAGVSVEYVIKRCTQVFASPLALRHVLRARDPGSGLM